MLKCTINGKQIEVPEGTNLIEAFKMSEQSIAHYCWHPGLEVAGVCRLCMVEIEGVPRLQIACNTPVQEGMVATNQSEKVKEATRWGLDFHLINHPLDCPICDQAGECELQEQYMEFGQYDSSMSEQKVKKQKVVDLGERVVLDSERCILCSRCVRFTDEVTKTNELGIFNRGDRSEIGTFKNRPLNNKYSLNTVDICPVGALTSKDFRFRQRVWLLKDGTTTCSGCSSGCKIRVYYNKSGVYRVKPEYDKDVNGYWMCDEGRDIYKYVNKEVRLTSSKKHNGLSWDTMQSGQGAKEAFADMSHVDKESVALVLTAQFSVEELEKAVQNFKEFYNSGHIYHWENLDGKQDEFDGLLIRGDKNPNTQGLRKIFTQAGINTSWQQLEEGIESGKIKAVIVGSPENLAGYSDFKEKVSTFSKLQKLIWLTAVENDHIDTLIGDVYQIPLKTFIEKSGTTINHSGLERKWQKVTTIVSSAFTLDQALTLLTGQEIVPEMDIPGVPKRVTNDRRVINEFAHKRGPM